METRVVLVTLLWLGTALAVMASGVLAGAHPPTLQIIVVVQTLVLIALYSGLSSFAEYARSTALWRLTIFHLWRVIPGIGFLLLYRRGLMPRAFAVPAGIGDIAVAILAPVFAWIALRSTPATMKAVLVFHLVGLLDLIMVVSNAARLSFADATSMRMLSQAPLVIVPIFFVPLTICLHVVAIDQCRRALTSAARSASNSLR
jgi:hypothetical protein